MATLFKPTRPYPLPSNPEIVTKDGKPHVRITGDGKAALYPLSRDGAKYLKPSKKWYGQYTDAAGVVRREPLSPNKDAAKLMLAAIVKRVENERAGVVDRFSAHRKRPLASHLDDWLAGLRANGRGDEYVALKESRVRAVLDGCGWVFPADMTADRLELFLAGLRDRRPDLPDLPPCQEEFTMSDLVTLLGVGRTAIPALVRRHRLAATGTGKARRFPRETVSALVGMRDKGASVQTVNDWLQAVRQFAKWLADNGRIEQSPFTRLKPGNVKLDLRRRRGEFTPDEVSRLLTAARNSCVTFRGLSGDDRAMIYRVALGTGFRAAELAALTPFAFDLDADPPTATLTAEFTKNRQAACQPLPAELSSELRTYLADRPERDRVWPGAWHRKAADMIRIDLNAAGVPFAVDGPEGVEPRT